MSKCPLCDTPWVEHGNEPCLHAVIAALEGKWVFDEFASRGDYEEWLYYTDLNNPAVKNYQYLICRIHDRYTQPEHVLGKLVDLWEEDSIVLDTYPKFDDYGATDEIAGYALGWHRTQFEGHYKWIAGDVRPDPALAVLIAWVVWKLDIRI